MDGIPPLVTTGFTALTVVAVGVALWIRLGILERTATAEIIRLRDRVHQLANDVAVLQGSVDTLDKVVVGVLARKVKP